MHTTRAKRGNSKSGMLAPAWGLAILALLLLTPAALAAPINHGDFSGTDVVFQDVTESTLVGADPDLLYGAPTVSGNQLTFMSISDDFAATASGGSSDFTGSLLSTTIMQEPTSLFTIDLLLIEEEGTYALSGAGGAANASASMSGWITVLENLSGPTFVPPIPFIGIISPSDPFELPGDSGTGNWTGSALIDIASFAPDATKIKVSFDNNLDANSEASTSAHIEKDKVTITVVPEPATALLLGGGLLALGLRRSRKAA
jgi:hypothetical protein